MGYLSGIRTHQSTLLILLYAAHSTLTLMRNMDCIFNAFQVLRVRNGILEWDSNPPEYPVDFVVRCSFYPYTDA